MEPKQTVGERIREARLAKGLTQEQLAVKAEFSLQIISRWERGDKKPSAKAIRALAQVLDIDPRELDFSVKPETNSRTSELGQNETAPAQVGM